MSDLAMTCDEQGTWDLALFDGDLIADDSLRSAILVSLLTDAEAADVPAGEDRRGWWGDALAEVPTDRIGCLWWTLAREKQTPATLQRAQQQAEAALAWLIQDDVASAVRVRPFYPAIGVLDAEIDITQPSGVQRLRLSQLWAANFEAPFRQQDQLANELGAISASLAYPYYVLYPELTP